MSPNGVCYDIKESPYRFERCGIEFRFSSVGHLDRFRSESGKRMDWLNDSMSRRFHLPFEGRELALVQLYMQIEKRGFFIRSVDGDWSASCPQDITYVGRLVRRTGSGKPSTRTTRRSEGSNAGMLACE